MRCRGLLIVLSAPSGGGKTTICRTLLRHDPRLVRSRSATTRLPRPGERRGRDYLYLDGAAFQERIRRRLFLEWAVVHGHRYGTPKAEVMRQRSAGRDVILVIDVQGGLAVKRQAPEAVLIFVRPPSLRVLAERLRGRGTDSQKTIRQRLRHARGELALASQYDYVVVNQRLPVAVKQIQAIITAERLRQVPR